MKRLLITILIALIGLFLLIPGLFRFEFEKDVSVAREKIYYFSDLIYRHTWAFEDEVSIGHTIDSIIIELLPGEEISINFDTAYAGLLMQIGLNYFHTDSYEASRICGQLWLKAFHIYENAFGENHVLLIDKLYRLAEVSNCGKLNKPAKTAAYYERALALNELHYGKYSKNYAHCLSNLGQVYFTLGRLFKAEEHLKKALDIFDRLDLPPTAAKHWALCRLVRISIALNKIKAADNYTRQALALTDPKWDRKTRLSTFAQAKKNIGNVYMAMGRYEKAAQEYREALDSIYIYYDNKRPIDYSEAGANYNNLGEINYLLGQYDEAVKNFKKATDVRIFKFGPDNPFLTYSYTGLAETYIKLGKYEEAEHYLKESQRIIDKTYSGMIHPHEARTKNLLGTLYRCRGNYRKAGEYYYEALEMCDSLYGSDNSIVAEIKENLAVLYAINGNSKLARHHFEEILKSRHKFIDYAFTYSSRQQKALYLKKYPLISNTFLTFARRSSSGKIKDAALEMILKGKARITEALMAEKKVSYCEQGIEAQETIRELSAINEDIAELYVPVYFGYLHKNFHDSLNILCTIRDSLEFQLSTECADFRESYERKHFDLNDIVEAIPEQTVLWEFCRYHPHEFNGKTDRNPESGGDKYLAFSLDSEGHTDLVDLGRVDVIDNLIDEYRNSIYASHTEVYSADIKKSQSSLNIIAGELYQHLFSPLPNDSGIIISPDGLFGLLPFGVLRGPDNKYVIEKHNISYLSSGRDLLQSGDKPIPNGSVLIMADPDYDLKVKKSAIQSPTPNTLFTVRNFINCLGVKFDRLYEGINEAAKVIKALKDKTKLKIVSHFGAEATEENIKNCDSSARFIHIITHAFFCYDTTEDGTGSYFDQIPHSGIVCAGANNIIANSDSVTMSGCEDGILMEYEVSGLNLPNAELVTISGCESGLGTVQNGEGIYGLRRAFQHAGARAVLMSLWKVPDPETGDLMDYFYNAWFDGKTKTEALRRAKLKVIESCRAEYGCAHPLFWGAFIIEGRANN